MTVPGHCHFRKIQNFMNEHYEEEKNYRKFLKLSCQEKVGEMDLLCVKSAYLKISDTCYEEGHNKR